MPRIPTANQPGLINHNRDTVHMQGAPGIDWNTGTAKSLAAFGRSFERATGSMLNFLEKEQAAENDLAAIEAQNLFDSIQNDLQLRMAENPGKLEEFNNWAKEADNRYRKESEAITARMSRDYRTKFDARMAGAQEQALQKRANFVMQAKVTNLRSRYESEYKSAALAGNVKGAADILGLMQANGLLTDEQVKIYRADIDRLAQSGEIQRLAESNPLAAVEALKARNQDGSYSNYTNLPENYRKQMIAYAERENNRRQVEWQKDFATKLVTGEQVPELPDLKEMLANQEIDIATYQSALAMLDRKNMDKLDAELAKGETPYDLEELERLHDNGFVSDGFYTAAKKKFDAFKQRKDSADMLAGASVPESVAKLDEQYKDGKLPTDEYLNRRKSAAEFERWQQQAKQMNDAVKRQAQEQALNKFIANNFYDAAGREKVLTEGEAAALSMQLREIAGDNAELWLKGNKEIYERVEKVKKGEDFYGTFEGKQVKAHLGDLFKNFGLSRQWNNIKTPFSVADHIVSYELLTKYDVDPVDMFGEAIFMQDMASQRQALADLMVFAEKFYEKNKGESNALQLTIEAVDAKARDWRRGNINQILTAVTPLDPTKKSQAVLQKKIEEAQAAKTKESDDDYE